jgi:hypothetical protein
VAQRQPDNEEKQHQSDNEEKQHQSDNEEKQEEKKEEKEEEKKDEDRTNPVRIDLTGDDRQTRRVMRDIVKRENEQRNGQ